MSVSIIIPLYNQKEYISDCIESVLSQTIPPLEIIVVDDGSTDGSGLIAEGYKEQGIKVIHQVNKGLAPARNTGIMNSHGDYIFFLDSDDMLEENAIEILQEAIDDFKTDIIAPSFKEFGISNRTVVLSPTITLEMFKDGLNYLPYFCAFRKSKLLEVGGYSPRMIFGYEDLHLTINLLSRGATIKTLSDILVLYRTKENSMIHEAQAHHEELMAQIHKDFNI